MNIRKKFMKQIAAIVLGAAITVSAVPYQRVVAANTQETPGLQLQTILIDNNGSDWKTESWGGANLVPNSNWTTLTIRDYYENGFLNFEVRNTGTGSKGFNIGLQSKRHGESTEIFWTEQMAGKPISAGTEWTSYSLSIKKLVDANADSGFSLDDLWYVSIRNAGTDSVLEFRNVNISSTDDERQYPMIKVNQVGYELNGNKTARVSYFEKFGSLNGKEFQIVNAVTDEVVYTGLLPNAGIEDVISGERVHIFNFDEVTAPGTYFIRIPDTGLNADVLSPRDIYEGLDVSNIESVRFQIKENVYENLLNDLSKYYYYQRQGITLEEKYAGDFARENLHPNDNVVKRWSDRNNANAETYDVSGGWYDAGDYGKYLSPAASSVSDLLFAFELFPEVFNNSELNIPETDKTNPRYADAPGILSEIKWELDMILKFEHKSKDGSFFVAANYADNTIYMEDTLNRNSTSPSETDLRSHQATASAAAILAHAYVVYKDVPVYADFADECLEASLRAWKWLTNPANKKNMKIDAANRTYTFSDADFDREMFWAAGAIYRAVKESGNDPSEYENFITSNCESENNLRCFDPYQSVNYSGSKSFLGYVHYLYGNDNPDSKVSDVFKGFTVWKKEMQKNDNWGTAYPTWGYWWGSNQMIAQNAMNFLLGSVILDGKDNLPDDVVKTLENTFNYLMGINPVSFSYVSGNGENSVENIYSGIYSSDKRVDPYKIPAGYFTEGTNNYDNRHLSKFDGKCYLDSDGEYTTNENTLYGNAAMIFLTASVIAQTEHTAVKGDVNADGKFNIADLVMMEKWLLNADSITDWTAGDLVKDNKIDVYDFVMMRKLILTQ